MTESTVRLAIEGRRADLTLDNGPLNILDLATLEALDEALARVEAETPQLLVVRGAGERAFSAGVAVQDHVPERIAPALARFHGAIRRLRRAPSLSLAVVDGHCLGGGLELAAACDLVLASDRSRFGVPEIKLGCYPPVAAAIFPARMGRARALELMVTGRLFDAVEAERLGLLTRVVPSAELTAATEALVSAVLAASAPVVRLLKRAAAEGERHPFDEALDAAERLYLEELTATEDMHEGIAAFLEKREPVWRHR